MNTIKLYKVECTKAYMADEQGAGYSLGCWGGNTAHYEGCDDGGKLYTIPDGYHIERTISGCDCLYDEKDRHCSIVTHSSGLPEVVSLTRRVVLKEAE